MTEGAFLEELTLAEGELIDDYVAGRLSPDERTAFERHFLSTEERREQLRFTRAVGRYASAAAASAKAGETASERETATTTSTTTTSTTTAGPTLGERLRAFWGGRSAAWRAGLAFAAVAAVAFAVWLAVPRAPRTFATLTLVAGAGERAAGVEPPGVRLPPGTDALRVTLTLPAGTPPAASYRVEMMKDKGRTEEVEVAGHDARAVTVVIPEGRLARGRHALRLFDGAGRRVGDSYVFDVE
ncbi:MAG: zf-HC2 domain-containing protein [Acidobacteria bacterium]|nr:zf-HC2 domain-containing protein [Acidobacteriota bacterium]